MEGRGTVMPRPPKGILKNKGNSDSSRSKDDDWDQPRDSRRKPSDNGQAYEASEGSGHILRHKLNEFISRKGELLFRPLSADEVPLKEERGTDRTTQDYYGLVPSMDFFLSLDPASRRRHFFNTVHEGELLIASLTSKTVPGLHLKVLCMEGGRGLVLDDLGIEAFCPTSQMVPPLDPKNPNRIYGTRDLVRCEILKVNAHNEHLVVGMKGTLLAPELLHVYQLGLIFEHDLPPDYALVLRERNAHDGKKTYEEVLESSAGFRNPNNIVHLASCMGVLNHKSTLMAGLSGVFPVKETAKELRRTQNGKWAHGSVADGIRHFKAGNYTEAFQCLNKAISIDAENVEGLVARGALYANKAAFEKAIEDFESALRFNPSHYNARKYLAETLVAYGKQEEAAGNIEDAVAKYSKCLAVRPDHGVAKEALWALYARTEKLDTSMMSSSAAAKTVELKEKLKLLLQEDIEAMKMKAGLSRSEKSKKSKKDRKSRKDSSDSDSSDSSSNESDSDSSSSDSDSNRKKKKKSRKKKSKRSKKSKKEKEKERQASLSPFSKRLAEHGVVASGFPGGSDLVGFSESTYAEWGKRVGVAEIPSEDEEKKSKKDKKKRKSKEKRNKKKRESDSSSESDSSEGSKKPKQKRRDSSGTAQAVIPDLGDLEAKLTAYYSKVEKEKVVLTNPALAEEISPSKSKHSRNRDRDREEKSYKSKESRERDKNHRDRHEETSTKMETQPQGFTLGKIQLNTDQYGNFIHPEKIVRTVVNETAVALPAEDTKPKFEMKFRVQGNPGASSATPTQSDQTQTDVGSKWRKIGMPPVGESLYVVKGLDGTTVVRKEDSGRTLGIDHSIANPLEADEKSKGKEDLPRNYRTSNRRSRSRSRSRSPRGRRRRRSRSRSDSRSRSRSRRRRSSRSSDSRSRSRSRSRSPAYRSRRRFDRGGGGGRFFRGFRHDRGRGGRGFFRGGRGRYRPSDSRMRNVFRSRSRSRGRYSRSRSRSPRHREDRSRSRDRDSKHRAEREKHNDSKPDGKQEPEIVTITDDKSSVEKVLPTTPMPTNDASELQIGTLTTTNAKDVEVLLDQRNAQKKEEMRERNPDFFRAS